MEAPTEGAAEGWKGYTNGGNRLVDDGWNCKEKARGGSNGWGFALDVKLSREVDSRLEGLRDGSTVECLVMLKLKELQT